MTAATPEPEVIAHCGPDMAAWIDPDGSLQRAGLLIVDHPAPKQPPAYTFYGRDRQQALL